MHPAQMMCPMLILSMYLHVRLFFICPASITSFSIHTTEANIFVSWETLLPYVKLFEISHSINGDTTKVITTNQAMFEVTDLSPDTNIRISIQPITACGPVGSALVLNTSTDVALMCKNKNI